MSAEELNTHTGGTAIPCVRAMPLQGFKFEFQNGSLYSIIADIQAP